MRIFVVALIMTVLPGAGEARAQGFSWLDSANTLYTNGMLAEALPVYRRALQTEENPSLCYFNMANAFFQLDSLPQSIVYYQACISTAPEFFRAWLNLSIAYFTLDDIGSCVAATKRALELEPENEKALLVLGAACRRAGAYPHAVTALERLISINSRNEEALLAMAEMYRELEDPDEAVAWLLRYPEDGANRASVLLLLAEVYEGRGILERAIYYLSLAWDIDSSNRWVYYRMVVLQEQAGNDLVALQMAASGVETMPDFAPLALYAGNIAFNLERYTDAERYYLAARNQGSAGAVVGLENIRLMRQQERIR